VVYCVSDNVFASSYVFFPKRGERGTCDVIDDFKQQHRKLYRLQ
jgi:hypothetical protein